MLESKLDALRKKHLWSVNFFFEREGGLRFCYAIMQFRWFMIPSLYRLYDRSSNGEQKDLLHAVTISRRKTMENTVAHNFHESIWIYSICTNFKFLQRFIE